MVQRYTPYASGYGEGYMCESAGGDWVEYEDYERLKQEFMDYMVVKEKQIANLERALGAGETRRRPQGTGRTFR